MEDGGVVEVFVGLVAAFDDFFDAEADVLGWVVFSAKFRKVCLVGFWGFQLTYTLHLEE